MVSEHADFQYLVSQALKNPALGHMRPVIEKELIHFDLLYVLDREGLLDNLVFQGGTSLRLCYGGSRFSEDLDFAGGLDFTSARLADMKVCIEDYLSGRYGLEVTVKEPASLRQEPGYAEIKIDKWQIGIETAPARRDLPRQKIKLEVANIPAYTSEPMPLQAHYDFLPKGYADLLIMVETREEIMADKLLSLPATRRYVRNRDIWDLAWLAQRGVMVDSDLVRLKVECYRHEQDDYLDMVEHLLERLPSLVDDKQFKDEMMRFLPADAFDRTVGQSKFQQYLLNVLSDMFDQVLRDFQPAPAPGPEFRM